MGCHTRRAYPPKSAGFFVMAEIIKKAPEFSTLRDFYSAYEYWREFRNLRDEGPASIVGKLIGDKGEIRELEKATIHHDPFEIACEAADIFLYSMTLASSLGVTLDGIFHNGLGKVDDFEQLEKVAEEYSAAHNIIDYSSGFAAISDLGDELKSPDNKFLLKAAEDLMIAAVVTIRFCGFPLATVLTAKTHRNHIKYKNDGRTAYESRASWDPSSDIKFLQLQLGMINEFTLNGRE